MESPKRSIIKSLSWRITATLTTVLLVFLLSGNITLAFSIGGLEIIIKLVIYYLHERVWTKINWGLE